ncbi:MAG TPA: aspartyl protease family protein [Acetobacteraceae bacterium]|nr:aspartyl protease family protein [Acetobacteraceae bacterium]
METEQPQLPPQAKQQPYRGRVIDDVIVPVSVITAILAVCYGLMLMVPNTIFLTEDKPKAINAFTATGSRILKLTADSDGRYYANCLLGEASYRCLIDTGASVTQEVIVMADKAMAHKARLDLSHLKFNMTVSTPSGSMRGGIVPIPRLCVGPFVVTHAYVLVVEVDQPHPTITIDFLQHYKMTLNHGVLTLSE